MTLFSRLFLISATLGFGVGRLNAQSFDEQVLPLLNEYCVACHSGDEPAGQVDFELVATQSTADEAFELWAKVDNLLRDHKMPPEDETQPTNSEREAFHRWYQSQFVDSVVARPATFRPRRLSATEYRNTLRSLFGFDLEVTISEAEQTITQKSLVLKLLPTDPPGTSGFRNDTHSNPLSTNILEQYSYLADFAIEELFSAARKEQLQIITGEIDEQFDNRNAESLLNHFLPRALRRNPSPAQLRGLLQRVTSTGDTRAATKREMKRILLSPGFLYRGLLMPREPGQQLVDSFELAERLSYFLWADMPDAELTQLAENNLLRTPATLNEQIERMLDSPKSETLATDFAMQWLALNEIEHVSNNPPYMFALQSQPLDFFRYLVEEDKPLLELIDSKTTFASPLTRRFYLPDTKQLGKYRKPKGIEIERVGNKKLALQNTPGRGGLLTMPGVLAMNRGPILRGVWMLERIMGEHLPDPPADVGQVEANPPGQNLSFRERFAMHREKASCAICHDKIDPLGFALQAYDDSGSYVLAKDYKRPKNKRNSEDGEEDIDTTGQLPSGEKFANFEELKHILITQQREPIVRNIVKRTLSYALCRKLEIYDQPTVDGIVEEMLESDGTWRDLVHSIVNSLPFQETIVPAIDEATQ